MRKQNQYEVKPTQETLIQELDSVDANKVMLQNLQEEIATEQRNAIHPKVDALFDKYPDIDLAVISDMDGNIVSTNQDKEDKPSSNINNMLFGFAATCAAAAIAYKLGLINLPSQKTKEAIKTTKNVFS